MDIKGLDKAAVLAALYNASRQQGMGFLDTRDACSMSIEQARDVLEQSHHHCFDYLNGRVLKINLGGDELNTALYNRDNGPGAAERAIETLRNELQQAA